MYTKEEWQAKRNATGEWVISADDIYIATVARHFNARLIAQAPRMYEALEDALQTANFEGHPIRGWQEQARQALAKVEGKE